MASLKPHDSYNILGFQRCQQELCGQGWADGGAAGVDCDCGAGCLFHLPTDMLEQHDRAAAEPTIFQALQKRLDEIRETTYAPDRGALDPAACVANEKAGGYWAPWLK